MADGETWINETFLTSVTPTYDLAGNLTYDGLFKYTYDAWNHLVRVQRPGTTTPQTIAQYAYDGLGRRYRKVVDGSGDRNRTDYFYYDNQWRILEMRNGQDQATRQFVWGSRYLDELICMDVDTDADGDCADFDEPGVYGYDRYRYFQDANWNVVAVWDEHGGAQMQRDEFAGSLLERYEYDPYGQGRIHKGWDEASASESLQMIGESLIANPIRYAGYFFDDETGLYHVRHRMYSPRLQRMLQQDPAGYIDGMSLYGYVRGNPANLTDPLGLGVFGWGGTLHQGFASAGAASMDFLDGFSRLVTVGPYTVANALADITFGEKPGWHDIESFGVFADTGIKDMISPPELRDSASYGLANSAYVGLVAADVLQGLKNWLGWGRSGADAGGEGAAAAGASGPDGLGGNPCPKPAFGEAPGSTGATPTPSPIPPLGAPGGIPRPANGTSMGTSEALDSAESYLGPGYEQAGPGRYVSADGTRQVRFTDSDLAISANHAGSPHMNFEEGTTIVKPNGKSSFVPNNNGNSHVYLPEE